MCYNRRVVRSGIQRDAAPCSLDTSEPRQTIGRVYERFIRSNVLG